MPSPSEEAGTAVVQDSNPTPLEYPQGSREGADPIPTDGSADAPLPTQFTHIASGGTETITQSRPGEAEIESPVRSVEDEIVVPSLASETPVAAAEREVVDQREPTGPETAQDNAAIEPETAARNSRSYPEVVVQNIEFEQTPSEKSRRTFEEMAQNTAPTSSLKPETLPVEPEVIQQNPSIEPESLPKNLPSKKSVTPNPLPPKPGIVPKTEPRKPQAEPNSVPPKPEVVPAPKALSPAKKQSPPESAAASSGNPSLITLHADNLDVRKALELISRQGQMNILVSPGVTGTVTLDLRDKTMDDALHAIGKLCQLSVRRDRDFLYVSTLAEKRLSEEDDLPIHVYRLNYVRSTDVEKMVKPLLTKKGVFTASPESETGLPSDASGAAKAGGSESTKDVKGGGNTMSGGETVIIQDYEDVLKKIDRVIAELDVQPIQVLIEAVIVSVSLDKNMNLGVNFGLIDGAQKVAAVSGNGLPLQVATGFVPAQILSAGGKFASVDGSGFSENSNGLKFGFVDKSTTGFIKALEGMGETKVLACPRILVLNKQRAEIHLGDQLGYATSTQTQTSTTQTINFMPVGTQLRLRPFISSDGMVRMEIHPERSSGALDKNGIPQTNAQQVTTNVMVPDGATIVIGGLIDNETVHGWTGWPMLARLPYVGNLFRETTDTGRKRELIVILTPRIWRPDCPAAFNYLGRARTQGLDSRVAQKPSEAKRDGPSLFELTKPDQAAPIFGPPPVMRAPIDARRDLPAGGKKPVGASQFR